LSETISVSSSVLILLRNDKQESSGLTTEIPCWHHHPSVHASTEQKASHAQRGHRASKGKASEGRVDTDQRKQ